MWNEGPSGRVQKENPYKDSPRVFDDKDRYEVATPLASEKQKKKGSIFSFLSGSGKGEKEGKVSVSEKELKAETKFLRDLATKKTEEYKSRYTYKYAFLSPFGTEDFDERILKKTIRSYAHRLKKTGHDVHRLLYPDQAARLEKLADQVYEHHIPAYTDVFSELDERKPSLEVFLGRDGAFMYYARRAQLWGRGEKTSGRIVYLNYPRGIMNESFSVEERKKYLKDRGITDVSNAVFIDTGYAGSIPEHILRKVFGMESADEVDKRILLIESSDSSRRQVRRTARNDSDVSIIEGSPMLTESASGLYEHPGNDKLTPYAQPNKPFDIFAHESIKFLCMRHFYLQGKEQVKQKTFSR